MPQSSSVLIIAEAGVNHNGSIDLAKKLIDVANESGADVVKFQTFTPEALVTFEAPKALYQKQGAGNAESQMEMLGKLALLLPDFVELAKYAEERKISFASTPFDLNSLDFLIQEIPMRFLKISSGDITFAPLLLAAAKSRSPLILSSGASNLQDIETALGVIAVGMIEPDNQNPNRQDFARAYSSTSARTQLQERVTLLHCTTEYPAPDCDINLRALETLRNTFGLKVGYSDHSSGIAVPLAAVALGATVIEKHFTLDRDLPGPDHRASLAPEELKQMVQGIRTVEKALGSHLKTPAASELLNREIVRRSVVAAKDIAHGEVFTEENLICKRPGSGISALAYWEIVGKKASKTYRKDEAIEL